MFTQHIRSMFGANRPADCASAEEEAAELEKLMRENSAGGMPDPEEIQEILQKARGNKTQKPPQFEQLTIPLKMFVPHQVNDGFQFAIGIPFSQKFQSQLKYNFSNKKQSEYEFMIMLMGGNPNAMMDQDDATFCQAQTFSSGRLGLQGQTKLPGAFKLSLALEMMGEDPSMAFNMFGVQKDFDDFHIQYQFQQAHMLSYMQTVSKNFTAGVQLIYHPQKGQFLHNYTAKYKYGVHDFMGSYYGLGQNLLDAGVCSRVSKNLQLFANFKMDPTKKSDFISGFRIRFPEWNITGTIGTSGKATTMYKRQMEMFEAAFQGSIDFKDDKKPATFGLCLTFGMQGGM